MDTQLQTIVDSFAAVLGANLIGAYLHGSRAMGDHHPTRSDLDILVVNQAEMSAADRIALAGELLARSGCPAPVEVFFLRVADMHPWHHPCPFDLHYSEDWRERFERVLAGPATGVLGPFPAGDPDLAGHITVLRARGKVLCGPPIGDVFPEVPRPDFLDSILSDVLSPEFGLTSASISPVYMVLNACRTLAYLASGQVLSKAEGGAWAAQNTAVSEVALAALAAYRNGEETIALGNPALDGFRSYMLAEIRRRR